ncbi:MAG: glycosyltransferase, partial [Planctomycetota bacterium]|nr:glycosyltransferase [Planctomycetota bacterium]
MIGNNDRSCAVIIVAYNNENSIGDCLDSVFAHSRPETAAVVVDNSPGDATSAAVERRRSACPDREIVLVRRPDNIGFAAGCNLGARGRTETHLLFLNPDAKLENDVIALLTAFLQANPRAKIAGPQIRSDDGQIVKTCRNLP